MTIADKVPEDVFTLKLDENGEPIGIPSHIVKNSADMTMPTRQPLSSSTNVVKRFKNEINNMIKTALGEKTNYKVDIGSTKKIGRYLFEKVNDEKVGMKVASEIADTLTNFSITDDNGNHIDFKELYEISGKSLDEYKTSLTNDIVNALKNSAKETKISKIQKVFDRNMETIKTLVEKNRESIKAGGRMNVFVNTRNKARTTTRMDLKWTDDNIKYNTGSLMIKPLTNIHTSGNKMSTKGFWENIEEWKANYTDKNELLSVENNPRLPYSEEFRDEMLYLEEIMPKQNPDGTYPSMNSLALAQATRVIRMYEHLNKLAYKHDTTANPRGRAVVKGVLKDLGSRKDGKVRNVVSKINDFASSELENGYTYIHDAFRNNPTINGLVDDSIISNINAKDYEINRLVDLQNYEKANKIDKVFNKRHQLIDGVKVSNAELAEAYGLLNTPDDYAELKRVGKLVFASDSKKTNILSKMSLEEFREFVDKKLPDNMKEYALQIKWRLNNQEKQKYNARYIKKNGVDSNSRDDYFPTKRLSETQASAKSKGYAKPSFGHSKTRVKNNNAFVISNIKETYRGYVHGMGIYLNDDAYDNFVRTMSAKLPNPNNPSETTTAKMVLINNYGEKPYARLETLMEKLGNFTVNESKEPTALDKGINFITNTRVATSLAGWATLKQPASYFTSNVRLSATVKRMTARLNDPNYRKVEGKWLKDNLPGLKNRSISNAVVLGNMIGDTPFGKYSNFVNKYIMAGVRTTDKITVNELALALPFQVEADYGFEVGSEKNRGMVKQLWLDTYMKQIGSTPAHATKLSSSQGLTRLFFGNFQGAINAYYSGVKDKIYTWLKYHGAKEEDINSRIEKTKTLADEAKPS